jgi:hypothetical protein
MKKYVLLVCIALIQSCDKNFEELNQNPNQSPTIDPEYLFSQSLLKGAGQFSTGVHTEIWTLMEWTQMLADLNEPTNNNNFYTYSEDWNNELWKEWYVDALMPVQDVLYQTENSSTDVNLHQMARIWKCFLYHRITDLWGSIPYSEALQGYNNSILTPQYDSQESIYLHLLDELKDASMALDQTLNSPSQSDFIFQGDITKWEQFANALICRLALRISDIKPTEASDIFGSLDESKLMKNSDDKAQFPFYGEHLHPFYELEYTGQGMRKPSQFLIEVLENDPRLSIYCAPTEFGLSFGVEEYVGVPNLSSMNEFSHLNDNTTSDVASYFLQSSLSGVLFSYAEQCFILAEASLKGLYPGDASNFMRLGIEAHMNDLQIEPDLTTEYLNNLPAVSLSEIQKQKWITFLYLNAFEAFAEKRRTGYPVFSLENNEHPLPKRLVYPSSEYDLNGLNVSAQGTINSQTPVWWNN